MTTANDGSAADNKAVVLRRYEERLNGKNLAAWPMGSRHCEPQPMNLVIVGAAGRTGRLLTELALGRGYKVSAVVHSSPLRLPHANLNLANLRIVNANAHNADDMAVAIKGHDVIVSILGGRSASNGNLLEDGAAAMLRAHRGERLRRYIVVSSGLLFAGRGPVIGALRLVFKKALEDCAAMENLVMASDVQWTIVRPPRLTGGRESEYRAKVDALPDAALFLTRAALAAFLLDEIEMCRYPRSVVGLG